MWIVAWRLNGKTYTEHYTTYSEASERATELYMMRPSIHYSGGQNEEIH